MLESLGHSPFLIILFLIIIIIFHDSSYSVISLNSRKLAILRCSQCTHIDCTRGGHRVRGVWEWRTGDSFCSSWCWRPIRFTHLHLPWKLLQITTRTTSVAFPSDQHFLHLLIFFCCCFVHHFLQCSTNRGAFGVCLLLPTSGYGGRGLATFLIRLEVVDQPPSKLACQHAPELKDG